MPWQIFTVAVILGLNVLAVIKNIDEYRPPITPNMAVAVTIMNAIMIGLLISGSS